MKKNTLEFMESIEEVSSNQEFKAKPIITSLSLIEADILKFVEERTTVYLHEITSSIQNSSLLTIMAIGGLIRRGLVKGVRDKLGRILVEAR